MRYGLVLLMTLMLAGSLTNAQELPRCTQRPAFNLLIRTRVGVCIESILPPAAAEMPPYTSLAIAQDGTLLAAQPLTGQVWAIVDTNHDGLPDTPRVLLDGLDTPAHLLMHDAVLYIAGGKTVYRWQQGDLTDLISDLPGDTGLWNGGLAIADNRLIVGIGADCAFCTPAPDTRGLLLSFALDGSDRRVLATGFRQPSALSAYQGRLYASDAVSDDTQPDEINAVVEGGLYSGSNAIQPIYALPPTTTPVVLLPYVGAAFPQFADHMLLLMAGEVTVLNPVGFQLVAIEKFGAPDAIFRELVPADLINTPPNYERPYNQQKPFLLYVSDVVNRNGEGWYPHQPLGMALNAQGWLYVALSNGTVYLLRP